MLYTVVLFGALGVIETIEGSHQVTGDAADALEGHVVLRFGAPALGAYVLDDAVVAAHGIAVDRVVHRAVAHAAILHMADNGLERLKVVAGVAIKLHVADVAAVRKRVIRSLDSYLVERADVVVHGHMEPVRVVVAVGHTGNNAVAGAIHAHETT